MGVLALLSRCAPVDTHVPLAFHVQGRQSQTFITDLSLAGTACAWGDGQIWAASVAPPGTTSQAGTQSVESWPLP